MKKSAALLLMLFIPFIYSQDKWQKLNGPEGGAITSLISRSDTILAGTGLEHGLIFFSTNRGNSWQKADFKNKNRVADFAFTNGGGVIAAANTYGVIKSYDLNNWFTLYPGSSIRSFWSVGVGENENLYAGSQPGHFMGSTDNGTTWFNIFFGDVDDLIYFNGYMFASQNEFILRKEEPSGNWVTVFDLNINNRFSFTISDENTIFAPSVNYFYASTDTGVTWLNRDTTRYLDSNMLYNCVFNNRVIGACSDQTFFFGNLWGIIVSDDSGYTWRMSNTGLIPKLTCYRLACSGNDTYVGTISDGVYKSTDYGNSWTTINNGLYAANVYNIYVDKVGNIYSAAYGSGISKSTDKGFSWNKINDGLDQPYIYAVIAYDSNIVFAGSSHGLFKSSTGGGNWVKLAVGPSNIIDFYKDKLNRLYLLDYSSGIYRSTDAGNNWIRIMSNLPYRVMALAFDSTGNLYAGTRGGYIYKSTDDGASWTQKYHSLVQGASVNGLCVTPNGFLFATSLDEGILRSTDSGNTWNKVNSDSGFYGPWPIESNNKGELYTSTRTEQILFSTNYGNTWEDITSNGYKLRIMDITFDDSGYVYFATDESVWRSAAPVPVEFISFTSEVISNNVTLNWSTATETNNKGFEIERRLKDLKIEKLKDWEVIGFVEGKGTTTEKQNYTFIDENLSPGNYKYRLKQIDYDGTFEYSNEIEVTIDIPFEYSLSQNYPNPFNPTTKIKYSIPQKGNVIIRVYDILGREVETLINREQEPGEYEINFKGSKLASGIYFYQLKAGEFSETRKMMVVR